ncbi:response regulator receiver modulated diguanylate cyclase [Denitrovibrio acetiphilus DSM 12809]|uniref:diguanylate cyclase n=1 Tax=Denitrovibrio acetiphilus (strain DSM 12809 / NBRC 114555 / N2460) TaxID=522772 RepID=D4H7C3_DENA2|nr:diguanylate cyclase [Denitrovibrio acetiphilus]ADD67922.1 response regulator receiver modulated diguanylate cyclase [Denitrovibrio acetiphilus DSM 12809]
MFKNLDFLQTGNVRVLVIDGSQSELKKMSDILSANGYEPSTSCSGERGIMTARQILPDIILLEADLPDISGYEVCKRLKSQPQTEDVPVIFITADTEKDDVLQGFNAGATDYIIKPYVDDVMIARVSAHSKLAVKSRQEKMLSEMIDKYVLEIIIDTSGIIKYISSAFARLTGYEPDELIGKSFDMLKHPEAFRSAMPDILDSVKNKYTYYKEIDIVAKNGDRCVLNTFAEPLMERRGNVTGAQCFMVDVTSKKELELIAVTDKLTRLHNRQKLDQVMNYEMSQFQRYGTKFSVIIIDADDFKTVNNSHSYHIGDKILVKISGILLMNVRDSDTCGRWGGDEFLVILPKASEGDAVIVAEKLRKTIAERDYGIDNNVTVSIGVAEIEKGETVAKLVASAGKALYKAKKSGKNCIVAYSETDNPV